MKHSGKLLSVATMLSLFTASTLAAGTADTPRVPSASERAQLIKSGATRGTASWSAYIVRLDDAPLARYRGGVKGLAPTSPRAMGASRFDADSPASRAYNSYLAAKQSDFLKAAGAALGRNIDVMAVYRVANNGLGLWLRNDEIATIEALAGVASVEKEKLRPQHTDAGPMWIGAPSIWDGSATNDAVGTEGEGIIIGVIDTGVNHDHPSFADPGPVDGYDHVNPLGEYKGLCDGTTGAPYCNDKLIGVYDCNAGGVSAGGDGSGNTPPLGPQVRPLSGGGWSAASCAPLDGPHEFADANGTTIEFTINTTNPADDITMNLYYSTDPLDPEPTQVVAYDFLFGLETTTYTPSGGVPVGHYWAEVCSFGGTDPIGPATYAGSLVWNDLPVSGAGDACSGGQPEDGNQHGSHTASTAGGNRVNADIVAPTITIQRDMSGVAPHANLITYAGCLPEGGCLGLSLANAIEQIVIDGVDVVNYSIGGGPSNPWGDTDSQGFLSAREAGIWVATSASNDGPGAGSIGSPADAPWITTVGASTHNRVLANQVEQLSGGNTAPPFVSVLGKGLTSDYPVGSGTAPIIYAGDTPSNADLTADPALCAGGDIQAATNPWSPGTFSGEIVVCDRGEFARVDKCTNVCEAGAGGCILANDEPNGNSLVADGHTCPSVHISYDDGVALKSWLADGGAPGSHVGRISGAFADLQPINGDIQAGFSSRGPNRSAQNSLKPDVTNPGVDILAAVNTVGNTTSVGIDEYGSLSGTSMSSPHTAGSFALLRVKRPEFTPAEAQSALMMTSTRDLTRDSNGVDFGDPFDRGAGRVNLFAAARAGLVMDEGDYGSSPADAKALNIPSFADVDCESSCTWTREVKSAASVPVTWTASHSSEDGVVVTVTPSQFTLAPGATQVITVTADIASADHATPQGPAGPTTNNESQYHAPATDTAPADTFNVCLNDAGRSHDCWVFADVELMSSESTVPNVSMPLAARSTGDFDGDGIKDLVDVCPLSADHSGDDDLDGIPNACDNCLDVANPSQCDSNGDGYGNHCDGDLNNNNVINFVDLGILKSVFMTDDADADLNCNGVVNFVDLGLLKSKFLGAPGPSAVAP